MLVEDQLQSRCSAIHLFQLLLTGTAALQRHVMLAAYSVQIRKVRDHRGLLAAEGKIDEVRHIKRTQPDRHSLELGSLIFVKAVQPPGQVVHLIQVGPHSLQPLKDGEAALQLVHPAVPFQAGSQFHSGQAFQGALIFHDGDGEGDGHLAILRVRRVAQDTAQHRLSILCGHICCPPISGPWRDT